MGPLVGRGHFWRDKRLYREGYAVPGGRVKGVGHGEFTYPRQTPLLTSGRERTLWRLAKALKVKVTELLE